MESRDDVQDMWRPWSLGMRWPGCDKRLAIMSVRIQAGPLGPHSKKIIAAVESKETKKESVDLKYKNILYSTSTGCK